MKNLKQADGIKSSFYVTGIWPVNRLTVAHNLFEPAKAYDVIEEQVNFAVSDVLVPLLYIKKTNSTSTTTTKQK